MFIHELKHYIKQRKLANMWELSQCFSCDPDALRPILQLLQRKGCIYHDPESQNCATSSCHCNPLLRERYQWCDKRGNKRRVD